MTRMRTWATAVIAAVVIVACGAVGLALGSDSYKVSGISMEPTLHSYDLLIGRRNPGIATVAANDVIVVRDVHRWSGSDESLVKRVVAVGGDHVTVAADGRLSVNGRAVAGDAAYTGGCPRLSGATATTAAPATLTIPHGSVFVRGDNVNHSDDSRYQWCHGSDDYLIPSSAVEMKTGHVIRTGSVAAAISRMFGED